MAAIRPAREGESADIRSFIISIMKSEGPYDPSWPARDIERPVEAYAEQNGAFLVAEENGRIIGTLGFHKASPRFAILRRFYVAAECRGKGIGKQLLARAFELCKAQGYVALITISEPERRRAFDVYSKAGFIVFRSGPRANFFIKYLAPDAQALYPVDKIVKMNWILDWDGTEWKSRH